MPFDSATRSMDCGSRRAGAVLYFIAVKYLKHFTQGSNVVVLQPGIQKAFPTSEAVNKALASMLAFAQETQGLAGRPGRMPRKRATA